MRIVAACAALLLAAAPLQAQSRAAPLVLESFDDASAFAAVPSDGVLLTLRADSGVSGRALRMAYDFQGRAGYAVARRPFTLPTLPPHWAITLWVRGEARPNTLELKLVDGSGQNVWWMRRPELRVAGGWTQLRFRSSDLSYAWGPLGGGAPRGIAALEIAFTAGQGGRGWLALDQLALAPLAAPVAASARPAVSATSAARGHATADVIPLDFDRAPTRPASAARRGWRSGGDGAQWLSLDFGGTRQVSGLALDWSDTDWPLDYTLESSDDGRAWTTLRTVRGSAGGRRFVHLPLNETSHLRLVMHRSSRGAGYALRAMYLLSDSAAATRSAFLERIAAASAPGLYPRPLTGQQSYWTVLGVPRDERDGLFSEDGAVESRPGGFSLEPFLRLEGRLLTWRDAATTHSLDGDWRPIPSSRRVMRDLVLATTALVTGEPGASVIWVRYRVVNRLARARQVDLDVAVRPVQVNPPWQFLGTAGGAATITRLSLAGRSLVVNDTDHVVAITPFQSAGVAGFDAGGLSALVPARMARTAVPPTRVDDATGLAEGVMRWTLRLAPRDSAEVWLALPTPGRDAAQLGQSLPATPASATAHGAARLAEARAAWDAELGTTRIDLPASGAPLARTLRSALAYVLINARGPAIQPGTRSYRRSWIRDGALTSSALMRLGHAAHARAFLDWYVPFVFADGKVPCCVDARGSDPVTENDADGELLYLAAELVRITGDTAAAVRHWPTLGRVAAHLDSLRESRRTPMYRTSDSLLVFGLLPPSISHEGYSAKAAYSYWDDWWGVRGLDDAGVLAGLARDTLAARRYIAAGREMRRDVVASVARSMKVHGVMTLPGAAELGDLDPTSSTMALEPAQAMDDLPRAAVEATFDSAWTTLQRRRRPGSTWEIYTPYEWRNVGAFIRLGQPARAHEYAEWLMTTQRPREWNQWSEAIWRAPRTPKFIGDMPHGWVMSDFARATIDMLAYERERDSVLVVGAGVPHAWARADSGVTVRDLHTWWGRLQLTMRPAQARIRVEITGVQPPGGVELYAPFGRVPGGVTVNGRPSRMTNGGRTVMVRAPAIVEFSY